MKQTSFFELPDPPPPLPTLPYQGSTADARWASLTAAQQEQVRREHLKTRYLDLLLRRGALGATDHEAAEWLCVQVCSLCSTRAALRAHLTSHGHRVGPTGKPNTVWVLRIAIGQALGHDQEIPVHA